MPDLTDLDTQIYQLDGSTTDDDLAEVIGAIYALPGLLERARVEAALMAHLTDKEGHFRLPGGEAKRLIRQLATSTHAVLYDCLDWIFGGEEPVMTTPDLQGATALLFPSIQQRSAQGFPPATAVQHTGEEWLVVAPTKLQNWLLKHRQTRDTLTAWRNAGWLRTNESDGCTLRIRAKRNRYQFARVYLFEGVAIAAWRDRGEAAAAG